MPGRRQFFLICFGFIALQAKSQDRKLFTGHFENYSFPRWVKEIESGSAYHFYFEPAQVDSLVINLNVSNISLEQLLDQVLQKTDLHYSIDPSLRVFVTKGIVIRTKFPPGYFDQALTGSSNQSDSGTNSISEPAQTGTLKMSENNKLFEIGLQSTNQKSDRAVLTGYIRDSKTGEPIFGASVSVDKSPVTVNSDQFGYFSITLSKGKHALKINNAGAKEAIRQVMIYADGKLDIELQPSITSLKAVIVTSERTSNVKSVQMGVDRLNIRTIKQIPSILGETDILKVLLTLPGVTSVGEASNGFNVRGGSADQNLILFNDATIYNPSHLFGFFSAFNPDVVKGIELYKSAIPEKYGGRLSSVLDVSLREGNNKNWTGSAGIGPLTSKFLIEGPLKKDKTSLIAAVRTTYSDWLLNNLSNKSYRDSKANFYDANLHISHTINAKNSLYITGYISSDRFNLNNDTAYKYSNANANIKWKHVFDNRATAILTAGIDHYQYAISSDQSVINAFKLGFTINQSYFRGDFTYIPNNKHTIKYGISSMLYKLYPGSYEPGSDKSLIIRDVVPSEKALESAVYLGDQYSVTRDLSFSAGIRYSLFNYLGPHDEYDYLPGFPRTTATITDTTHYANGKNIKTYSAPEIRLSARYALTESSSVKISFNTLEQYIHMLSNTTAVSPTDIWKLSDPHIRPQQGAQVSLGYYRDFKSNTIETSVEVYYKTMKNFLDYKSGADLVLNKHIETDVFTTKGKAYGIELLIKKTAGKVNGWLSYTYSRTFLKEDDPLAGETINKGDYYPASFDKPHSVNFIGNYRFSHRLSLSLNIIYSTGRPITLPLAVFDLGGSRGLYYSQRNQYRIPDYFRSDISLNLDGNHKIKKSSHNFWSFGIYNVTGRQNAYSVYFVQEGEQVKGYQLSIFGTLIPFITYNIKF
jgi:hypothetical protein